MLYKHLFFHAHSLSLNYGSSKDMPYFFSLTIVALCFMFNVQTMFFLLETFDIVPYIFKREYKWFFPFLFLAIIYGSYMYKERYKLVYQELLSIYGNPNKWTSISIVILYYVLSFIILLITGMYKNGDWIFS